MPRLLFALLHQRFSGTVRVEQPAPNVGLRTVWFRGGMPVFTDWVEPAEVLGQVLVRHRMITEPQLLQALEAMAQQGGLLGHHLVQLGLLGRQDVLEGLRHQCVRKLAQLFSLSSGQATVTVGGVSDIEDDLLPLNVLGLILAGVGVAYDETRAASEMGPALQAPVRTTGALDRYRPHFRFRPSDEPALAALARGSDLVQMSADAGISQRRSAQLIYTLWACQMLRTGAAAQVEPGAAAPIPTAAADQPVASTPGARVAASPRTGTPRPASPTPRGPVAASPRRAAPTPGAPIGASSTSPSSPTPRPAAPMPASPAAASPASPVSASPPSAVPTPSAPVTPAAPVEASPAVAVSRETADDQPTSSGSRDEDEASFVAELAELEARMAAGAHGFALFGVPLSASKRDIRRAWGELSRKFHPDALQRHDRDHLRDRVNAVFAALSEAQQVLGDAERREQLREAIERGEHETNSDGKDATARAHAVFQSELLAKEADKLLRANKFARALERYREALTYNSEEPDVHAAVTWCVYQLSDKKPQDASLANQRLTAIIADSPRIARAHYFLGFVLIDTESHGGAIDSFRRAAKLDPRLIDAERQARALKARVAREQPAQASSKGGRLSGLKGLFGGRKK